jgi:autotransporter-associated beta strand protein
MKHRTRLLLAAATLVAASSVHASTWNTAGGGSWATGSWTGGTPNGIDAIADFSTQNITTNSTITLDGAKTIGTLQFGDTTASNQWTISAGTGGALTLSSTLGKSYITGTTATVLNILTDLAGTDDITFSGAGADIRISGATSYTGKTIVTGGAVMSLSSGTTFGATSVFVADKITLDNARIGTTSTAGTSGNRSIGANYGIVLGAGGGTFEVYSVSTLTINSAISGSGPMSVNWGVGGKVLLNGANSYTGNTSVTNGDTLEIGGSGTLGLGSYAGNIANGGTLNFATSANQTLSGILSGTGTAKLNKSGTGTLTLSGANTYTGKTTISAGTLSINSIRDVSSATANALGKVTTVANGTIDIGSGATGATLIYTGTGDTTNRVINLAGTTGGATLDQSATSGLIKFTSAFTAITLGNKTLTLQGSNLGGGEIAGNIVDSAVAGSTATASGTTGTKTLTVSVADASGLRIGQALSGNGIAGSTTITAISGTTVTVNNNLTATIASGSITAAAGAGTTGVTKNGTGTWTLSGANTYTGGTTVTGGTLVVASTGAINVGAAAAGVTVAASSTLAVDGKLVLTSATPGLIANSGGTITLNSASSVLDLNNLFNTAIDGQTYQLITGGGTSGNFKSFANYTGSLGLTFNAGNGTLTFQAVPEPSTYGLVGAGALAAVAMVRRRRKTLGKAA